MLNPANQERLSKIKPRGTTVTDEQKRLRARLINQQKNLDLLNLENPRRLKRVLERQELNELLEEVGVKRFGVTEISKEEVFLVSESDRFVNSKVIVLVTKQDYSRMNSAPSLESATEILHAYAEAGDKTLKLTSKLKSLGYDVWGHHPLGDRFDNHFLLFSPLAYKAGLGEKGRTGLFIDFKFGSLVRLSAISINAEIEIDQPIDRGISAFCARCKYCVGNCPVSAITNRDYPFPLQVIPSVDYKIDFDRCFKYFEKHFACSLCTVKCVLNQPTVDEIEKRVKRIENWYTNWVLPTLTIKSEQNGIQVDVISD